MTDASSTELGDDAIPALWPNDRAVLAGDRGVGDHGPLAAGIEAGPPGV